MGLMELRLKDLVDRYVPPWLANRVSKGLTSGHRYLWGLVAPLDALLDVFNQGLVARFPGVGTPTALPYIGRSRSLIRNQNETAAEYGARLEKWLDTHPEAGSQEIIGVAIHSFLANRPRVRVINRAGLWLTVEEDGEITRQQSDAWDWDSVSHPERNEPETPWWSDLWVVVQVSQWAHRDGTMGDLPGHDGYAWGHYASLPEVDAVKGLFSQWKGAHSRIRAVIWTTDPDLFDPDVPASCPDGTWGEWGIYDVDNNYVPSGRNLTSCRYWEPR
jgi:hypothetical protein